MSASEDARGIKSAATVEELVAATKDTGVRRIAVRGDLANAPSRSVFLADISAR